MRGALIKTARFNECARGSECTSSQGACVNSPTMGEKKASVKSMYTSRVTPPTSCNPHQTQQRCFVYICIYICAVRCSDSIVVTQSISLTLCHSVCQSLSYSACLSLALPLCHSVYPCVGRSICESGGLSMGLSVWHSLYLSVCLILGLSVCLFDTRSICLSGTRSICASVRLWYQCVCRDLVEIGLSLHPVSERARKLERFQSKEPIARMLQHPSAHDFESNRALRRLCRNTVLLEQMPKPLVLVFQRQRSHLLKARSGAERRQAQGG